MWYNVEMKKIIFILILVALVVSGYFIFIKISNAPTPPASPLIYKDLIEIDFPNRDAGKISSPVIVRGVARGQWYFEASFPIQVLDEDGTILGSGIGQAQGEWTTTDFVPFTGEINFTKPKGQNGSIVFKKDNPSGLPANDDSVSIPVNFK